MLKQVVSTVISREFDAFCGAFFNNAILTSVNETKTFCFFVGETLSRAETTVGKRTRVHYGVRRGIARFPLHNLRVAVLLIDLTLLSHRFANIS